MKIQGKKFLVTGGAGMIGSHIVDQLLDKEAGEIVVLDNLLRGKRENLERALSDPRVKFVNGDICDGALLRETIPGTDGLFHMAALRIKHCIEEPDLAVDVMFSAPIRMMLMAAKEGVARTVFASSSSLYGQAETFPTEENHHPYDDVTFYGAGKLAIEGVLRALNDTSGFQYAALRFFNVYGSRMDIHGVYTEVMVRWMDRITVSEPPLIFGDGSDAMDFTYVGDAARACVLAMENDGAVGAYNIGTGRSTDLNELCDTLIRVMKSDLRPEYKPADKTNAVRHRQAGTRKAMDDFGFEAEVSLEDGLRELVEWWSAQRDAAA